jgi:predicted nucleic acid-binding protein
MACAHDADPRGVEYLTPAIEDRAVEVQQLLADRGRHRAPAVPDLLIAATAELAESRDGSRSGRRICLAR